MNKESVIFTEKELWLKREEQMLALVGRYFEGKELSALLVPSLEETEVLLLSGKPEDWWGGSEGVYQWALNARDEIIDSINYIASSGRGCDLHTIIESEEF